MTMSGLEHRGESYEDLIDHLEKLESSLPYESIPKKLKSKDAPESTSILKNDKTDKKRKAIFAEGTRISQPQNYY